MKTTAVQAAKRLKALGFNARAISEPDDTVDGQVAITDSVSVSVGWSYAHVVKVHNMTNPDPDAWEWQFYPAAKNYDALVADLRKALEQ
jgi:hypothetical protein